MRVQVYRNFRTGGFSIRDKRSRRVVDRAHVVVLEDAIFKTGSERSWVEGVRLDELPHGYEGWPTASEKVSQFVDPDGRPVRGAKRVVMAGHNTFYEE